MSIRVKAIIILLLFSLIPIIFFSTVSVHKARNILQEEIGSRLENIAIEKAHAIEEILDARVDETHILAAHPMIINALHEAKQGYAGLSR